MRKRASVDVTAPTLAAPTVAAPTVAAPTVGAPALRTRVLAVPTAAALALAALAAHALTVPAAAAQQASSLPDTLFEALQYRHVGPLGNRVIAVAGEPGDPNVYYAGAASGGIWKSTDGGHQWTPIFDEQPASSIGSLAIAPSDRNVVWAGTGETFIRANISIGDGIYRSTDGGETWERRGLERTGRIGRVLVHPADPDHAYACALGHIYGPQPERGVYRTRDGGATWEQVLFVDPNTGCADLVMDPNNPRILFAGMWEVEVNTWSRRSGGPGSGLWTSRDGGTTWKRLEGEGLPDPPWGKIGLGMSAADSKRVYALIETSSNRDFAPSDPFQGVLWRSDDGGESWSMVNGSNDLASRPLYYTRLLASPADADEIYFMATRHFTSLDGGATHARSQPMPGYDHHDMWIDPADPDRMIVGHDGGVSISSNHGRSWYRPQLPIAQMYHVNVDHRVPYFLYGNRQDGPSTRGPSNSLTGGTIPVGEWRSVGGCETGFAVPDTVETDVVWTGCYDGILERHDLASGHSRNVSVWPLAVESWPGEELAFRWQWTFPIEISPHDHRRVYVGSQYVHRTTDGGQSWEVISPDLTSNDPELQRRTGGLTLDDAGPTMAPTVFAIRESALEEGLIWVGTNDGYVQLTVDGGATWTNLTGNLRGVPPRGTISNIEPSRHAAGTAYLTVDRHQLGDTEPYIFRTTDYGRSWRRIDAGIQRSTFSYTHVVREDPVQPGLLYAGTENGVWVSFDDGGRWQSLQSNLPHAPVHWLAVQEIFGDLVVATYGRGFWILDDITPLRALAAEGLGETPALLPPRPAFRLRSVESPMSQPDDPAAGRNPEYGASLHYYLPEEVDEETELALAILDAAGEEVAEIEDVSREAGLHRAYWNLRGERTTEAKLRTRPAENPHVPIPERGWRSFPDGGRAAILLPPGEYTVRLRVADLELTRPLTVLKDPNSAGSEADIRAQMPVLETLWEAIDRSARLINEIEGLRVQLADLKSRLSDAGLEEADEESGREAIDALTESLEAVEGHFFDLRHTGTGQDALRWKRLLYARLAYLTRSINQADYPPTDQQAALATELESQVAAHEAELDELKEGPLAELNAWLAERSVPHVIAGPPR